MSKVNLDFLKTYRTGNKWAEQALVDAGHTGMIALKGLDAYLDQPRFSGLKYKYYATPGNAEYMRMYRHVPIKNIINYANTMMRPLYADFTECNENEEFASISGKFYYELFIQEYIFVSYNVFEKSEAIVLDPRDEKNKKIVEAIKEKGGFDLWVKLDENEYSESVEFMHIDTSLVVKFPKWREKLAWCRWGAIPQDNLSNWMNIAGIELALTQYLDQCIRLCGKKLVLTTQGQNDAQVEKLNEMLNSFHNYLHFNLKNNTDIEPLMAFEGGDLESIKNTIFYYLDRLKFEYGRVANTNPKGERITSGENYKDISAIANRQKETLEYLINFGFQVKKLWGIELDFAVSGIPEKEAIYTMSHMAQTPNMEKQMAGQIEGTDRRPPVGQKIEKNKANMPGKWSH